MDSSVVSAAILAGGFGTRLRSVVPESPKVLAKVLNRPFITFLLDQLDDSRMEHVVLCTGYKGSAVRNELGFTYKRLRLTYSQEDTPLGTGGALRLALPYLESDVLLVMNGDSFFSADLNSFVECFLEKNASSALLLAKVFDTGRFGQVDLREDGQIKTFIEKGEKAGSGWINAGIYLFERKLVEAIPAGVTCSLEYDLLPALIGKGLYGFPCDGRFIDIGTPRSYSAAESFLSTVPTMLCVKDLNTK